LRRTGAIAVIPGGNPSTISPIDVMLVSKGADDKGAVVRISLDRRRSIITWHRWCVVHYGWGIIDRWRQIVSVGAWSIVPWSVVPWIIPRRIIISAMIDLADVVAGTQDMRA
jgi:hypothetical protein